ncbi:hypothetical protein T4A_10776 [Trichinella pseudospiralis]|uniref:Uncharacterized protein n=1 Tax=Trichinella pseudospiralis TaxID=6337 RepID=A0A0V1ENN7_TRIPS|nr:hypothetical protein T4A_10776 [Trichinella pseudospiralis]
MRHGEQSNGKQACPARICINRQQGAPVLKLLLQYNCAPWLCPRAISMTMSVLMVNCFCFLHQLYNLSHLKVNPKPHRLLFCIPDVLDTFHDSHQKRIFLPTMARLLKLLHMLYPNPCEEFFSSQFCNVIVEMCRKEMDTHLSLLASSQFHYNHITDEFYHGTLSRAQGVQPSQYTLSSTTLLSLDSILSFKENGTGQ